ncbi:unnamed protein product [Leuciscus chuanchicus]
MEFKVGEKCDAPDVRSLLCRLCPQTELLFRCTRSLTHAKQTITHTTTELSCSSYEPKGYQKLSVSASINSSSDPGALCALGLAYGGFVIATALEEMDWFCLNHMVDSPAVAQSKALQHQ